MKQIQFGTFKVYGNAELNSQVREQLEDRLNHGWEVEWKIVGRGVDEQNSTVIDIVYSLRREVEDVVAKKVGRPAKEDA